MLPLRHRCASYTSHYIRRTFVCDGTSMVDHFIQKVVEEKGRLAPIRLSYKTAWRQAIKRWAFGQTGLWSRSVIKRISGAMSQTGEILWLFAPEMITQSACGQMAR